VTVVLIVSISYKSVGILIVTQEFFGILFQHRKVPLRPSQRPRRGLKWRYTQVCMGWAPASRRPPLGTPVEAQGEPPWLIARSSRVEPGAKVSWTKSMPPIPGSTKPTRRRRASLRPTSNVSARRSICLCRCRQSLLVVCKGSTPQQGRRHRAFVFRLNPQGVKVARLQTSQRTRGSRIFLARSRQGAGGGEIMISTARTMRTCWSRRVHKLVPKHVWSRRYDLINSFEKLLTRTERAS